MVRYVQDYEQTQETLAKLKMIAQSEQEIEKGELLSAVEVFSIFNAQQMDYLLF